jgi:hypothetical protein
VDDFFGYGQPVLQPGAVGYPQPLAYAHVDPPRQLRDAPQLDAAIAAALQQAAFPGVIANGHLGLNGLPQMPPFERALPDGLAQLRDVNNQFEQIHRPNVEQANFNVQGVGIEARNRARRAQAQQIIDQQMQELERRDQELREVSAAREKWLKADEATLKRRQLQQEFRDNQREILGQMRLLQAAGGVEVQDQESRDRNRREMFERSRALQSAAAAEARENKQDAEHRERQEMVDRQRLLSAGRIVEIRREQAIRDQQQRDALERQRVQLEQRRDALERQRVQLAGGAVENQREQAIRDQQRREMLQRQRVQLAGGPVESQQDMDVRERHRREVAEVAAAMRGFRTRRPDLQQRIQGVRGQGVRGQAEDIPLPLSRQNSNAQNGMNAENSPVRNIPEGKPLEPRRWDEELRLAAVEAARREEEEAAGEELDRGFGFDDMIDWD